MGQMGPGEVRGRFVCVLAFLEFVVGVLARLSSLALAHLKPAARKIVRLHTTIERCIPHHLQQNHECEIQ